MHPAGGQPHITGPRTHQALPARREARLVVERGRHPGVRQHLPGAAAVAGGQDAERAVHRVAHREAVSAVEEGHAVVEGLRVGVAEGLRPGRSGVVGAVDAGRLALADRQDDRVPRVERLDVPELEVGRAGRRDVPPARPAVGRAQHRAAVPATHAVFPLTADSPRNRTSAAPLSLSSQCGARCAVSRACAGTAVSAASAAPHAMATAMLRYVRPIRRVVPMRLMAGEASPLPGGRPDARVRLGRIWAAVTEVTRNSCARIGSFRRLFQCGPIHSGVRSGIFSGDRPAFTAVAPPSHKGARRCPSSSSSP